LELIDRFTRMARIAIERAQVNAALEKREAELSQANRFLTKAQRVSQTGSFTWDIQADEHRWSDETYRIFDFEPGVRVTMPMILAAVHPDDLPLVQAAIGDAIAGTALDLVFRINVAAGVIRFVHAVAHPIEAFTGRPVFLGALQDITQRKLAEEALSRARSELAHVSRLTTLSALTASIAHEINQPLAGIITNASTCLLMLDAQPPNLEGAKATAQRTIRDGNRTFDVIQRLRALFAKKTPASESVDLNDAARDVIAFSTAELHRARVALRLDLDNTLPPVIGDRVQLQQVILNLLHNGADAMAEVEDRPRDLIVTTASETGGRVRLSVRDVGVGVQPDASEKLFEAFHTTKPNGMGIGLAISRSIIESHEGRLWVEPNNGPGATFVFSIPAALDATAGPDARHVRAGAALTMTSPCANRDVATSP
jgi:signal transduction histidine kinase